MCPVDSLRTEAKFKKTEIGEIPVDWELFPLKSLAIPNKNAFADGPFGSNLKLKDYVENGIPVLQGKNITSDKLKWFDIRFVSIQKAKELSRSLVRLEDILMTKIGTVGCAAIVDNLHGYEFALIPANMMKISLDRNKVDINYFYQWLIWSKTKKRISEAATQTAQPALSLKVMKEFKVTLPKLVEQRKIAEILSTVDEAIEKKRKIIIKTKQLKKGLMQELLTRGIGHSKFKKSEISEIPVEWELVSANDILKRTRESIKIGPFGSQLRKDYFVRSGYKVYGQENIFKKDFTVGNRRIDKERFKLLSSFQLYPGDVVITMMGTVGQCSIVPNDIEPGIMDSHLLRLEIDEKKYSKELLVQLISSSSIIRKQIKQLSVGGIMEGLSSNIVKKLIFPCPPVQEQKRIAGILLSADQDIQKKAEQEGNLEIIKNGLAEKLLAGKLRVFK